MSKIFFSRKGFAVLVIGMAFLITALAIFFTSAVDISKEEYVGRHQYQILTANEETQAAQNYVHAAAIYSSNFASDDLFNLAGIFQEVSDTGEALYPPCGSYQYLSYSSPQKNCTPQYRDSYESFFQRSMSTYLRAYNEMPLVFSFSLGRDEDIPNNKVRLLAKSSKEFRIPIGQPFRNTDYTISEGLLGGFTDEKIVPCTTGACVMEVADYFHETYDDAAFPYVWGGETPYPVADTIELTKNPDSFFYQAPVTELKPGTTIPTEPGFDCSGWAWWVGKHAGIKEFEIRKTAINYYLDAKSNAKEICGVNSEECLAPTIFQKALPGDILFLGTPSNVTHMMLYSGDGKISHSVSGKGLVKEDLPTTYASDTNTNIVGVYRFKYADVGIDSLESFNPYDESDSLGTASINDSNKTQSPKNNSNKNVLTSNLAGPSVWCDGTESLPKGAYAERIEQEAWNSQGQTYFDIAVQAGLEKGVDPALITTHMIYESSMGNNNRCTAQGKSSLTGCTWYPNCTKDCSCGGTATLSDLNQLSCTARADRIAFDEAMTGIDTGTGLYQECNAFIDDPDKMWTCVLCIYQGNYAKALSGGGSNYFTRDGTCNYAENFKNTYCSWRNYFDQKGYDAATFSGPTEVTNSYLSFTPYIDTTIDMNFDDLEKVSAFVKELQETCVDDLENCVAKQINSFNSQQNRVTITFNEEKDALARDVVDQLTDCSLNKQDNCLCTININTSLKSNNYDKATITLNKNGEVYLGEATDKGSVSSTNKLITTVNFNPVNVSTGESGGHSYVELILDKQDMSNSKFEAEDWNDDYTWELGTGSDHIDALAVAKSNNEELVWVKYVDEYKHLTCRENKNYFRLQANFLFTDKTMDFSIYLNDSVEPKLISSDAKQLTFNPTNILFSWSISKNSEPLFAHNLTFYDMALGETSSSSILIKSSTTKYISSEDKIDTYQTLYQRNESDKIVFYYLIGEYQSTEGAAEKTFELNHTYIYSIKPMDHYNNEDLSITKKEILIKDLSGSTEQIMQQLTGLDIGFITGLFSDSFNDPQAQIPFEAVLINDDTQEETESILSLDECTYCGINRQRFGLPLDTYCVKAKCPSGAVVLETNYYNQCSFTVSNQCPVDSGACCWDPCRNACGPTSVKMVIDTLNEFQTDIKEIQCVGGEIFSKSPDGKSFNQNVAKSALTSAGYDVSLKTFSPSNINLFFDTIEREIGAGNRIIFSQKNKGGTCGSAYGLPNIDPERCYCAGGHVMVIVGYSSDYLIINDPFTLRSTSSCPRDSGNNLVISKENIKQSVSSRGSTYSLVVQK